MIPDGRGAKLPLCLLDIMHVDKKKGGVGGERGSGRQKVRLPERNPE